MGSFHNPVGGNFDPKDPYDRYRTANKAPEKEERNSNAPEEQRSEPATLGSYFLYLAHKVLGFILHFSKQKREIKTDQPTTIFKDLSRFKKELDKLKSNDLSQETSYLSHLCELWHNILEDSLLLKQAAPATSLFKQLLQDVHSYPPAEEFSFGYYLNEYAGQNWIPLPYIELVQKLFAQHQKNPETSALTVWTEQIDAILSLLDSEILGL